MHCRTQGAGKEIEHKPAATHRSVGDPIKTLCHAFSTAGKWFCLDVEAKL